MLKPSRRNWTWPASPSFVTGNRLKMLASKLIAPGHPEKSMLYLRMDRRGQGQMPPLATAEVDREAVKVIHDWIKEMK